MTSTTLKGYRVNITSQVVHRAYLDASSSREAEKLAEKIFEEDIDCFEDRGGDIQDILVEEWDARI